MPAKKADPRPKIAWVPHPITAEEKAEYRSQGYKIVDIKFLPENVPNTDLVEKPKAEKPAETKAG